MTARLVLVAMGVDAQSRSTELAELAEALDATVAYLQGVSPSLVDELERLYQDGARSFRVARVPVGINPPARSWLSRVVAFWLTTHPDAQIDVRGRDVKPQDSLTSPGWESVPGHRLQVFVCRGPRCAAKGADAVAGAINADLGTRGLGDDDVLVTQTGCMFPCNHAPVVVAHPVDRWFGLVDPVTVPDVLTSILDGSPSARELRRGR